MKLSTIRITHKYIARIHFMAVLMVFCADINAQSLSSGQFYYGASGSTVKLTIDEIDGITEADEAEFVVGKLILGNFYANGHVDSYIAFPFRRSFDIGDIKGKFTPGIEAGYNIYLLPLGKTGHSPFIGAALSFPNYDFFTNAGKGSRKYTVALPVQVGYGFFDENGQIDIGFRYAYGQAGDYYFSPEQQGSFDARYAELFVNYKKVTNAKMTEVGAGALPTRKDWWLFFGLGLSSTWFTQGNDVQQMEKSLSPSSYGQPIGELTLGAVRAFSQERSKRLIMQYSYRPVDVKLDAYEKRVRYQQIGQGLEFLYNPFVKSGFAPFFGVGLNHNKMRYTDQNDVIYQDTQQKGSFLLGWDVLPNKNANFHLRFGLRYMGESILRDEETDNIEAREVKFPNLEVSYVNLIWQY